MRASEIKDILQNMGMSLGLPLVLAMVRMDEVVVNSKLYVLVQKLQDLRGKADAICDILEEVSAERDALIEQNATLLAQLNNQEEEIAAEFATPAVDAGDDADLIDEDPPVDDADLYPPLVEEQAKSKALQNMVDHCNNTIAALEIELEGSSVPVEHHYEVGESEDPEITMVSPEFTREQIEAAGGKVLIKLAPTIRGMSLEEAVACGELPESELAGSGALEDEVE
jgi:hypothetical protein